MARGKYRKGRPGSGGGAKSYKTDSDTLKDMVKAAVKEAMGEDEEKNAEEEAFEKRKGRKDDGIDIGEVIEAAFEMVEDKRKSRKDDGEDLEDLTVDEVLEAAEEILEDILDEDFKDGDNPDDDKDDDDPEDKDDDDPEDKDDDDDEGEKRRKARGRSYSSKSRSRSRKSSNVVKSRKYANIYFSSGGGQQKDRDKKQVPPDIQLARAVKCLDIFGKHDPERAAYAARKHYQDTDMARQFKALSVTDPVGGGYLVPESYMTDIIELLYPQTVVFELGAQRVPMPTGNLNIPKMTAGSRARWGGELRKIKKSQPKHGNLRLSSKRLEALIPQSRELIMSTAYTADQIFANDLTMQMRLGLDFGALESDGTEDTPLGISKNKNIEHFSMGGTPLTPDNIVGIRAKVLFKNVNPLGLGWTFNSIVEGAIMNLKTTTGAYLYRDEMLTGKLFGAPYKVSNQIEVVEKGAKYTTKMIFGNWTELLMGEQLGLETFTSFEGTYTDENGTVHSALEENLAITRALTYGDVGTRHDESFIVIEDIDVTELLKAVA